MNMFPVHYNSTSREDFQHLCRSSDLLNLSHLIAENKLQVNRPFSSPREAPLVIAIEEGNLSVVSLLLSHGANPNWYEGLPLRLAIRQGNLKLVNFLLEKGSNPNFPEGIPLWKTIINQKLDIMRLLLDFGANPNCRLGEPLLVTAIYTKNLEIVELLLGKGAEPDPNNGKPSYTEPNPVNGKPLFAAIKSMQTGMVQLLLDRGVDINTQNGAGLVIAIETRDSDMVRFLLGQGADIMANKFDAIRTAIKLIKPSQESTVTNQSQSIEILELLLDHAIQLAENPSTSMLARKLGQYSQLCKAVIKNHVILMASLLEDASDYINYALILDVDNCYKYRPSLIALEYGLSEVLKVFFRTNVDLHHIYWNSVIKGDLRTIDLCVARPGFDVHVRNHKGETALHLACQSDQLEVIKVLMSKYGLQLDASDSNGETPLFHIQTSKLLHGLLAAFPEITLNVQTDRGKVLLRDKSNHCNLYAALLQLGADPGFEYSINPNFKNIWFHQNCKKSNCNIMQYLQKLELIDSKYVESVILRILSMDIGRFRNFNFRYQEKCKTELNELQSVKISQKTSYASGKTLFDLIFLGANEMARYARNEVLLGIYEQHDQDFRKFSPFYGFILNFKLRRGVVRRNRLESALQLLCSAIGIGLPEAFAEEIFGYFSNGTLESYNLSAINN